VPLALSILVLLVQRLAIHKLPPSNMAASSWLALGPLGTGALGLINLGYAAPAVFDAHGLPGYGEIARGVGLIGGVLLWGYGLWWMGLAILITAKYAKDGFPFNIGWWGYTFPLGVYAVATLRLAALFPSHVLSIFGGLLVTVLAGLWLLVGTLSIRGAWRGDLFVSPCLKEGN
jgi:tellurite resistance protein TehA-like permease